MVEHILTLFPGFSVIVALVGFYFVIQIWKKWRQLDPNVIKARVFLDKKFLEKNWAYVFLAGLSITIHQLMDFLGNNFDISNYAYEFISELTEFLALLFLVVLAYEWYKVLKIKS